jgi:protoporphyrinogen/coproporphyrinogen III oxidase
VLRDNARRHYSQTMKRIAIIGGGISGLSAAFALEQQRRAGAALEYVLYEAGLRFGGVLVTEHVDGCVVEAGPDSFLTEKPWAADLCRQIGLSDQLIGSNDAARKTYILVNGRLITIPDGLMFMVPTSILSSALSPLFSIGTKLRIAREWFYPRNSSGDESVASFVERHYGAEMVDRLADPLLTGVYGGDASSLSVGAVLPRFVEMERTHGSLARAMRSTQRKISQSSSAPALFTSLKSGMQEMVDALVARLDPSGLRLNTPVQSTEFENEGWLVSAGAQSDVYDAVILAVPAMAAAKLLRIRNADLTSELSEIQYSSSVTVVLGYDRGVRKSLPPGFGFLVPRSAGKRVLAATFVHNKFSHRAPEDRALLRCFLGGSRDEPILELADDEILRIVREELRQILSLGAEPLFARVYKWRAAMAQYNVGHLERLERIERWRRQLPGLALAGNAYRGIGVPDCVRSGKEAAEQAFGGSRAAG